MTSRERVARAIRFETPDQLPRDFPAPYGTDFMFAGMSPSPDERPPNGEDEWGAIWENIGVCRLGEVKEFPLRDWADFGKLRIPDVNAPHRWQDLKNIRKKAGELFLVGYGISLYERVHFLRGLENTWVDIHEAPDQLGKLIDLLVEMNLVAIEKYAAMGFDGYYFCDDWGLQNRLMIAPDSWRAIWKPRYARVFQAARKAGLSTILHSCGYIVDILDDLVEAGMQVIHMDQQQNMGLELLGKRFGGHLTFFAPVDIQNTMAHGSLDDIRAYCHQMVQHLGRPAGGFIPRWYTDPAGAGHRQEAINAMCEEFLKIIGASAGKAARRAT